MREQSSLESKVVVSKYMRTPAPAALLFLDASGYRLESLLLSARLVASLRLPFRTAPSFEHTGERLAIFLDQTFLPVFFTVFYTLQCWNYQNNEFVIFPRNFMKIPRTCRKIDLDIESQGQKLYSTRHEGKTSLVCDFNYFSFLTSTRTSFTI